MFDVLGSMFDVLGSMFDVQKRLLSVRGYISKTSACCRVDKKM